MCLHGVSVVAEVLSKLDAPDLRVYLVWVPVLADDSPAAARRAAAQVLDPRVAQFWDDGLRLGLELARELGIPGRPSVQEGRAIAWDVYLVYPAGPRAGPSAPPKPAVWLHQLSHLPDGFAPRLTGDGLEARLRAVTRP